MQSNRRRAGSLIGAIALVGTTLTGGALASEHEAEPAPRDNTSACPEGEVEAAGFDDVEGTHADAIECLAWYDITQGRTANRYDPAAAVKRANMAVFLARTIGYVDSSALPNPPADPDPFDDVDPQAFAGPQIAQLAELQVAQGRTATTYEPGLNVTRAQMASFVARTLGVLGADTAGHQSCTFTDEASIPQPHRANVHALCGLGIAVGAVDGSFDPNGDIRRDQMAAYLTRALDVLAEQGITAPPSARDADDDDDPGDDGTDNGDGGDPGGGGPGAPGGPGDGDSDPAEPLSGYVVVSSGEMSFSDGGWGGWSCPAGTTVLGGGFHATGPVAASAPGEPGTEWPHHTFGENESGWVVRDAPDGSSNTIEVYAVCAEEPASYEIVQSSDMAFSDGGWGGWSCPAGTTVLGGGFHATGPVAASAPGEPGTEWPHHTFGENESGWVVRDAPDGSSNTIEVYAVCAEEPASYEIVQSSDMAFSDGGWGGWSCPAGTTVLGGGFHATGPVAASAPGEPGTEWPHHTFGENESGWVVRDAPDGSSNTIEVYAVCAEEEPGDEGPFF
jgi:hypothetical protein